MANRVPRFETHIRHMIRRLDRDKMIGSFDLWNYDDVVLNTDRIADRLLRGQQEPLHGEMPPSEFGGPWPDEWVSLFQRWVDADFPRLEMPVADVNFSVSPITSEMYSLKAEGVNPGFGYAVWLERTFGSDDPVEFSLFREPPESPPPFGTRKFSVTLDFQDTGARVLRVNGISVSF